jgi:DNA polymerase epsilon subunit 1
MATYNGDSFDFPFVDIRAKIHGISMYDEIGFRPDNEQEYKSRPTMHMDCFRRAFTIFDSLGKLRDADG